jgi:cytosine/adenosine deaminase-related metal-dependent hydrolase
MMRRMCGAGHGVVAAAAVLLLGASCAARAGGGAIEEGLPATRPLAADLALVGRVIDGSGASPIEDGVVLVAGERIVCVGSRTACPVVDGVREIDVGDGTILPGLIDLHVHSRPHYMSWFPAAGVTTIRDANNALTMVERLQTEGDYRPRLLWTGPLLDGERTVMRHFGAEGVTRPAKIANAFALEVTTPAEAREAVDSLAARGAPFVKLYEQLDLDVFRAAVERAGERDLRTMADLGMPSTRGLGGSVVDALQAMEAGVHSIEHASGYHLAYQRLGGDPLMLPYDGALLDSLAAATVRSGTAVVPTLSVFYAFSDSVVDVSWLPVAPSLPAEMREFFRQGAEARTESSRRRSLLGFTMASEIVRRVAERGGLVGAGSDAPAGVFNIPGGGIHREMELLVRAGLTPLQAIHAATGAAATIAGRDDIGLLRAGRIADILVVDGNPATDILATRHIRLVIQGGRELDPREMLPGRE